MRPIISHVQRTLLSFLGVNRICSGRYNLLTLKIISLWSSATQLRALVLFALQKSVIMNHLVTAGYPLVKDSGASRYGPLGQLVETPVLVALVRVVFFLTLPHIAPVKSHGEVGTPIGPDDYRRRYVPALIRRAPCRGSLDGGQGDVFRRVWVKETSAVAKTCDYGNEHGEVTHGKRDGILKKGFRSKVKD